MFYVYMHCRPDGSIFYVGKGKGRRLLDFRGRNPYHKRIVSKYGPENIQVLIIPCASEAEAFSREMQLIKDFRILGDKLANMTEGGEGCSGMKHSPASLEKIRTALKGKKLEPRSAGHSANISKAKVGKELSPEHREKIGAGLKGKPSGRKGKPTWNKGKPSGRKGIKKAPFSAEHCQNISKAARARPRRTLSEELKRKIGEGQRLRWAVKKAEALRTALEAS